MNSTWDKILQDTYYNPEFGYGSVKSLWQRVKEQGIPQKYVIDWYKRQETAQIFSKESKVYNKIIAKDDSSWQMDLTFYNQWKKQNKGYIGFMTIINITSKYAYAFPVKNKTQSEINRVFDLFMKEEKPKSITSDNEQSFINTVKRFPNIKHFLAEPNTHGVTAIVERFNKTIRDKITKYQKTNKTKSYVDVLSQLLKNYNSTVHSSTGQPPKDMTSDDQLKYILRQQDQDEPETLYNSIKIGQTVRVLKPKGQFEKGSDKFSRMIYTVVEKEGLHFILKNEKDVVLKRKYKLHEIKPVDQVEKAPDRPVQKHSGTEIKRQNRIKRLLSREPAFKDKESKIVEGKVIRKPRLEPKNPKRIPKKLVKE